MDPIAVAQAELERAKQNLKQAVHEARAGGTTWAEIGRTLGMTRQAAFKRFGHATNPVDGRVVEGGRVSIEQVRRLTEQVFTLISAGSYPELEELIHPDVRSGLPEALVMSTWARAMEEVGALESLAHTHVVLPAGAEIEEDEEILGTVVGVTTLQCEAGELMGRVAVDATLRVVGLLIVSPDHTPLPF